MTEEQEKWYERETAAFRAWWEAGGEKTYSETPTMAAGAGWLKRAEAASSEIKPTREAEYKRLLGEWLKKSEAHKPEIQEFKCGYQPFLERATRDFLAACERNEPEWP